MVSPYVANAYRAALEMPIQVPHINRCHRCGKIAALELLDHTGTAYVMIHCDSEECAAIEDGSDYAMGHTVREAAEKWNAISVQAKPSEPEDEMPDPQGDRIDRARDRWEEIEAGKGGLK